MVVTNSKELLISIIIPVYNVEEYLNKCLDSILLNNMINNYEIIIIDDGSTDNSGKISDDYASEYNNINVYHKKNSGLSSSRNTGIKLAKAKYILLVDSDDSIAPNMLSKLENICLSKKIDMISFDFTAVDSYGKDVEKIMGFRKRKLNNEIITGEYAIQELFLGHIRNYAVMNLYRRSLFEENKIKFPVGRNYEDVGTTYKLFFYAKKVYLLNDKLYFYLQRPGSISHINKITDVNAILLNYKEIKLFFHELNIKKDFNNLLRIFQVQKLFTGYRIAVNLQSNEALELESKIRRYILREARSLKVLKMLPSNQLLKVILLKMNILKIILRKK